jgi:hypothetical protein
MNQMLSVGSNPYYTQKEGKSFELESQLELVIIYVKGKSHKISKSKKMIESEPKLEEVRMIVSPSLLSDLITDLKLHQTKLEGFRKNSDQINSLIKQITKS